MSKGNPTISDTLCVLVAPETNGESQVAAAIITRVLSADVVNVRVFRDAGGEAELASSVVLVDTEDDALSEAYDVLSKYDTSTAGGAERYAQARKHLVIAFWPPTPAPEVPAEPQPAPAVSDSVPSYAESPAPGYQDVPAAVSPRAALAPGAPSPQATYSDPFAGSANPTAPDIAASPGDPFAQWPTD